MMAEGYIQLPLIGDVDTLTDTGKDYLEQSMGPNWVSRPGNPETILIEGSGQIAGELIDQAAVVPPEAFAYIGTSIYGIPMHQGSRASAPAQITFDDTAGAVMVPADSEISVPHPSGQEVIMTTDRDAVAPEGGGVVAVNVIALDEGAEFNGAFGESELVDTVEGVVLVEVLSASANGTDPEDVTDYLGRLTGILSVPRRPVLPEDHVRVALQVPGVGSAAVFNLYYPGTTARDAGDAVGDYDLWKPPPAPAAPVVDVERCTTVAITGPDGAEPDLILMNEVYATLDANRETNFLNFVIRPEYTSVDVKAKVTPYSGTSPEDAAQAAQGMIENWLTPGIWNTNPGSEGGIWNADTKVRLYEAVDFINRAGGVWYVEDVQMKLSSQDNTHWAAADIVLPGVAPIPTYGSIEITT
jgi:uncharacterized phage protein gp47/JayE